MDPARRVIDLVLYPRLLSEMASYDVAGTIHQTLDVGGHPRDAPTGFYRCGGVIENEHSSDVYLLLPLRILRASVQPVLEIPGFSA